MPSDSTIAVVHLVRWANGLPPLKEFLDSYKKFPGGINHELVIIFKGFEAGGDLEACRALLQPFPHREISIDDRGFDLRAFSLAARQLKHDYLCFLNSFSILLDPAWLKKLHCIVSRPGVGLVGATGSHESMLTNLILKQIRRNDHRPYSRFKNAWKRFVVRRKYGPFPTPHIRTNAFMIPGKLMRQLIPSRLETKEQTYQFESGKKSLTRRVQSLGMEIFVAGKDGVAYAPDDWPQSNTFRLGDQSNLLVADNQTRRFCEADAAEKAKMTRMAWNANA